MNIPVPGPSAQRLAICDDHPIVRQGFRQLIEAGGQHRIEREFGSAAEVTAPGALSDIDLLVLDLTLADGDGLEVIDRVRAAHPALRIVVLTMHEAPAFARDALGRGALGFLTKRSAPEELPEALAAAARGERYVSRVLRMRVDGGEASLPALTAREFAVFVRLARGETPQAVADALGISSKTVYVHRSSLMGKLGARTTLDLHRLAKTHGLAP
jgi:two-component system uhpT operon response regulator UhpA